MKLPSEESTPSTCRRSGPPGLGRPGRNTGGAWRSGGTDSFQSLPPPRVPRPGLGAGRPRNPPDVPQGDGGVAGPGRRLGCAIRTPEKIIPWVKSPENVVPGKPQFFATAMTMGGLAPASWWKATAGRPTKIEGNPDHPASLGSTDIFMQAATLCAVRPGPVAGRPPRCRRRGCRLHLGRLPRHPDRRDEPAPRQEGSRAADPDRDDRLAQLWRADQGTAQAAFPEAKWHRYEPVSKDAAKAGAKLAFGEYVDPVYHFDKADVILALDHDFLACGSPGRVADERAFAARRAPKARRDEPALRRPSRPTPTPAPRPTTAWRSSRASSSTWPWPWPRKSASRGPQSLSSRPTPLDRGRGREVGRRRQGPQEQAGKGLVLVGRRPAGLRPRPGPRDQRQARNHRRATAPSRSSSRSRSTRSTTSPR